MPPTSSRRIDKTAAKIGRSTKKRAKRIGLTPLSRRLLAARRQRRHLRLDLHTGTHPHQAAHHERFVTLQSVPDNTVTIDPRPEAHGAHHELVVVAHHIDDATVLVRPDRFFRE